jgi:hypothetical protein
MRLNEKNIGYQRAKAAQRGNESELADLLAQTKIELGGAKTQSLVRRGKLAFDRQLDAAEREQDHEHE